MYLCKDISMYTFMYTHVYMLFTYIYIHIREPLEKRSRDVILVLAGPAWPPGCSLLQPAFKQEPVAQALRDLPQWLLLEATGDDVKPASPITFHHKTIHMYVYVHIRMVMIIMAMVKIRIMSNSKSTATVITYKYKIQKE